MKPTDILILNAVPLSPADIAGNCRQIHLAEQLALAGFNVTLAVPNPEILPPSNYRVSASDPETLESLIRRHDTIISTGCEYTARQISRDDHIQIFDVADLRFSELSGDEPSADDRVSFILDSANLILCGNLYQRDFWLGLALGRGALKPANNPPKNALDLFAIIPYGHRGRLEPPQPTNGWPDSFMPASGGLVWSSGYDSLMDPGTAISAMVELVRTGVTKPLTFLPPISQNAEERQVFDSLKAFADDLDPRDIPNIIFAPEGLLPHQRRELVSSAEAVVCCMREVPDGRLWPSPPLSDAIWLQSPIVCTRGCFMAFLAEELEIGVSAAAGDAKDLAQKVIRATDAANQTTMRENLAELYDYFGWDKAIRPLLQYLQRPPEAIERPQEQTATWGRSVWKAVGRLFE